jgi:hypothetical protein
MKGVRHAGVLSLVRLPFVRRWAAPERCAATQKYFCIDLPGVVVFGIEAGMHLDGIGCGAPPLQQGVMK